MQRTYCSLRKSLYVVDTFYVQTYRADPFIIEQHMYIVMNIELCFVANGNDIAER